MLAAAWALVDEPLLRRNHPQDSGVELGDRDLPLQILRSVHPDEELGPWAQK
jgi:hypothetical protein